MADTWVTVGTSFQVERRENPNTWVIVTVGNSGLVSLTPLQARETAALLVAAADRAEMQKEGTLVSIPSGESK